MKQFLSILLLSLLFSCSPNLQETNSPNYINQVAIFGEMHGTKDIPEFFFEQIKEEFKLTKNVTVGLELPGRFNNLFNYFDSLKKPPSKTAIRKKLTEDEFWCQLTDGRDSDAMLALLVDLIHLKYKNPTSNVSILSLRTGKGFYEDGVPYFAETFRANKNSSGFILIGNSHARLVEGQISFASELKKQNLDVISLNAATKSGSFTQCLIGGICETKPFKGTDIYNMEGIHLLKNRNNYWFDGDYFIKKITPAQTAKNLTNECIDTEFKFKPFE